MFALGATEEQLDFTTIMVLQKQWMSYDWQNQTDNI